MMIFSIIYNRKEEELRPRDTAESCIRTEVETG